MESASVLPGGRTVPTNAPRLLRSYGFALAATAASGFLYLHAARQVAANDSASTLDAVITLYGTAGLFAPVAIALKGVFFASVVWGILQLLDVPVAFTRCLESIWSAEFLLAAPQAVFGTAALLRGAETQSQLFVPLGLDLLWTPASLPLAIASHAVNIFLVAWGVTVFRQLASCHEARDRRAAVAVAAVVASALVVLLPILQLAP